VPQKKRKKNLPNSLRTNPKVCITLPREEEAMLASLAKQHKADKSAIVARLIRAAWEHTNYKSPTIRVGIP
jgi:hypothetical protein